MALRDESNLGQFPMREPSTSVVAACGECGSEDLHFVACPEHHWAVASICYGCLATHKINDGCHDCGWNGGPDD